MKTTMIPAAAMMLLLTGCDYVQRADFKEERADDLYREAMKDYGAGRIEAAKKGFEKALRAHPGNASARFQLAVLQQETKDFLGAVCNYGEYFRQVPDSDKAEPARRRFELCRRELAFALAKELGRDAPDGGTDAALEDLRAQVAAAREARAADAKALEELRARCRSLEGENARLRRMVGGAGDDPRPSRARLETARALLEEDEDRPAPDTRDEAKALADELAADDGPAVLAPRAETPAPAPAPAEDAAAAQEEDAPRSRTYVVQPGDSLRKIAARFYGRKSAWSRIREANKATVPVTGEIRAGQTLVIP